MSLKELVPNILEDQNVIWPFPTRLASRKDLLPTATFAVIGSALVVSAAPPAARYFRSTAAFNGFNRGMSSTATNAAILDTPFALFGTGLLRKDSKRTKTALLAGEAVADAESSQRFLDPLCPAGARARFRRTPIARIPSRKEDRFNSFPPGHGITAFALATVISQRYGRAHRWIRILAYGGSAAIGFSRLTLSAHYPADVFVGAGLGYSINRFVVLRDLNGFGLQTHHHFV